MLDAEVRMAIGFGTAAWEGVVEEVDLLPIREVLGGGGG